MTVWPIDCFQDTCVLVTGGTSGIGAAIASAFEENGANVTVTGVTESEVADANANFSKITARQLDVRSDAQIYELIQSFNRLHHVINCAGTIRRADEHEPEVFADVVDINLTGTMRVCAAARALLCDSGGTIVNTASMLSFFGGGLVPGYSASKGGVAQLTKSLAIAYAKEGIRVNAVAPGWIETPLTKKLRTDEIRNRAILDRTPMQRWGKPQDLLGSVMFLSSPMASFITGQILAVDGGYMIA